MFQTEPLFDITKMKKEKENQEKLYQTYYLFYFPLERMSDFRMSMNKIRLRNSKIDERQWV